MEVYIVIKIMFDNYKKKMCLKYMIIFNYDSISLSNEFKNKNVVDLIYYKKC